MTFLGRILQNSTEAEVESLAGSFVIIVVIGLVYLCAAIYGFVYLSKKDAELALERRVFGACCMTGYIIVCLFTPICFTVIYFCVTLGMINDHRQTIVSPYNNNNNNNSHGYDKQQQGNVGAAEMIPVAVVAQPVYAEQKGSPATAEEQV